MITLTITIVGSFFGFGFALLLSKREDRARLKRARQNLNDELRRVQGTFNEFLKLDENTRVNRKIFLDNPIWASLVSTGGLLTLLEVDKVYYRKVLALHFKIHAIEEMETDAKYNNQRFIAMQEVADEIDSLLVREI